MKRPTLLIILWLIVGGLARADGPDQVLCPPTWSDSLIYYQSFDSADSQPEVNTVKLQLRETLPPSPGGMRGRCGMPTPASRRRLQLTSDSLALSPHRPLTISIWWSLLEDLPSQGSFELIQLHGRGFIGHFARGGPWCGLKQTAGVTQIYNLPNINNVNGIYDETLAQHLRLTKGQWHHSAMVITAASLVSVYTDGKLVFEARTAGRPFTAEDGFKSLLLGGGVALDEIMVLQRATSAEEIAEYVTALQQMRQAYPAAP